MNGRCLFLCLTVILVHSTLIYADADLADVQALQDLFRALNSSPQLQGWRSDGGDPCEESWKGVSCNGSSVIAIKIPNLNLTGYLGFQLSNLHNLKELDVSSNKIKGEIPYSLPPNITNLNLACNNFSQSIPYSLSCLKNLQHVNVSHNSLSGSIGNIFTSLTDLREMDLSYNKFTGALPTSFLSLTNLTKLFLQSNEFTGSVVFLIGLPLSDLNIQDNCFSGVLPYQFQSIHNLWIGGNRFDKGINYPSWDFPLENIPNEQNTSITSPPSTESSAIESYPSSHKGGEKKKKEMGPGGIALMIGGGTLVTFCAALVIVSHIHRSRALKLKRLENSEASRYSLPISTAREISSTPPEASPALSAIHTPPQSAPMHLPPIRVRTLGVSRRRCFSIKNRMPVGVKLYTVAELQLATNFFSEHNLLGKGSLGSVYKAEFPNGKISVVKNIDMVPLSMREEDQFMDVIRNASRLRHLNIVKLIGYCAEHGQHLLVYEYVRNLSLADALHCEAFVPLSWGLRVRIALGIARALNYLHSTCLPPVAHSNLKAANILLDEDLMPRICDCGLAVLKPLTSNTVKLRASEMAICDRGYIAPDHVQPGIDNCTKGDIYAFGVLLLELLSGRKPFDRSKPREEQYLVKWASSQLHVNESLEQMVDPAIKKTISSKALSRFADIVSLCIQPEKEFRPPMSEIVESLVFLLQQNRIGRSVSAEGPEVDHLNRSFRSTDTQLFCSPTVSYVSI